MYLLDLNKSSSKEHVRNLLRQAHTLMSDGKTDSAEVISVLACLCKWHKITHVYTNKLAKISVFITIVLICHTYNTTSKQNLLLPLI